MLGTPDIQNSADFKMIARAFFLVAAIFSLFGATIYIDRQQTLDQTLLEVETRADAVQQQAAALISNLNKALSSLSDEFGLPAVTDPATADKLRVNLLTRLSAVTYVTAIYVASADGRILASTDDIDHSAGRRAIYARIESEKAKRLYVGTPERDNRADAPELSFDVAYPIFGDDNKLLGLIGATLNLDEIQQFYNTLIFRDGSVVSLVRSTGEVIVRAPYSSDLATANLRNSIVFRELLPRAPNGTATWRYNYDGVERISAYRSLYDGRLVVIAGLDKAAALAAWERRAYLTAATVLLASFAIVAFAFVARREQAARVSVLRKQLALAAENDRIFAAMSDAFFALAPDWRITNANRRARELLLRPVTQLIGTSFWDAFPGAKSALGQTLERVLESGEAASWRVHVPELDRWFDCRAIRHAGAEAESIGGLALFVQDATPLMRYEAQLERTQRLDSIGQLTGGIAHDFNNLLLVVLGNADTLTQKLTDRAQRRAAELISIAANRAAELTARLLAFARRQPLDPRSVAVDELLRHFAPLLRQTIGEHIELDFKFEPNLPAALVDPVQLETAILNLAGNARDAMPDGGRLTMEVHRVNLDEDYVSKEDSVRPGRYLLVAVTDTGSGMSAESVKRAFEPFYTTKEVGQGTGLGLSMVYGFVKQSRGHVKIYSELGVGTTVKLYLPLADQPALDGDIARDTPPSMPTGHETVVVVEDDDLVRDHVQEMLHELGYDVRAYADGPAAIEALKQAPADLLLTDVILPRGMNGRMVADQATALYPALKVLYMSGYSQNTIIHQGRLDQGVQLIGKPFSKKDIARRIREILDGGKAPR